MLMLFTSSLLSTSWIITRPVQELLVRVKFTICRTRMYVNGRHWNTRKLLFAGTRKREPIQCRTLTRVYV